MSYTVDTRTEDRRGCGYRKPGGLYMVAGTGGSFCGKLPIKVGICPCCGQGIQQHRGFTWVSARFIKDAVCEKRPCRISGMGCFPFNSTLSCYGMMWVGEKFYKSPAHFRQEATKQGISKRLPFIPKDFVIGVDWILLAHPKTPIFNGSYNELEPAIFMAFLPERIEYVVKGDESDDALQAMADRGIVLVNVIKKKPDVNTQAPTQLPTIQSLLQ